MRRSRCDTARVLRVSSVYVRTHASSFAEKDTYRRPLSSLSSSDRTTKRTRTRTVVVGKPERVPTPLFPFSSPSSPSCRSLFFFFFVNRHQAGREAKVPKGIPRRCSALPCFVVPSGAPSLVPRVPGIPSSPSLPCPPLSLSFSLSLCSPACVCLYASNAAACDSEVTQKIFIDRENGRA